MSLHCCLTWPVAVAIAESDNEEEVADDDENAGGEVAQVNDAMPIKNIFDILQSPFVEEELNL